MLLIREVMFCKPGSVKPLVEKFKAIGKLMEKGGYKGRYQVLTDVAAERYWTAVFEIEVESMDGFPKMMAEQSQNEKEMQEIMKDYHTLVESGRREIYKIEN